MMIVEKIEEISQRFRQHNLIKYLEDKGTGVTDKIGWMRCATPFVMGFGDLGEFLSEAYYRDPLQEMVNKHMLEETGHAEWFIEDLKTLGINSSESINFLWGDETKESRYACTKIVKIADTPDKKITAILAIESSAKVFFTALCPIIDSLEQEIGVNLQWLGGTHREEEINHSISDIPEQVKQIDSPEAVRVIENVYEIFNQMWEEWYVFSMKLSNNT